MVDVLYLIFIWPLEFGMSVVLDHGYSATGSHGISIVVLSIAVNVALLPIFHIGERWQREERSRLTRLKPYIDEIKHVYRGQERYMLLRTLYRQNDYHPLLAIRSAIGLLIQIPFFIAAFHLLATHPGLDGVAFGPLPDLSKSDGLLVAAGTTINVMPFVMTAVNLMSVAVYTRRQNSRERIQLLIVAAVFFVLLYAAPVALVLYWTLNNVLSLVRIAVYERWLVTGSKYRHDSASPG